MVKAPDKEIEMSSGPAIASLFGKLPGRVTLYEVGPRDGLQNETAMIPIEGKRRLIEALVAAGLRRLEITSFVSPKWIPQLADAEELAKSLTPPPGVTYAALCPNARGLERALGAGVKEVAVFLSSSETHNKKNVNKTVTETLKAFEEVVAAEPVARREVGERVAVDLGIVHVREVARAGVGQRQLPEERAVVVTEVGLEQVLRRVHHRFAARRDRRG